MITSESLSTEEIAVAYKAIHSVDYSDEYQAKVEKVFTAIGVIPKDQLIDGQRYVGYAQSPAHDEIVEALWVAAVDAFVVRKEPGPKAVVDAYHYFAPYPDTEYLFVPHKIVNEPQGESDEQLRRPPAEHTA